MFFTILWTPPNSFTGADVPSAKTARPGFRRAIPLAFAGKNIASDDIVVCAASTIGRRLGSGLRFSVLPRKARV